MLEIRRMGPKIGVEIRGIDVKTMDDDDFAKIYQAWLDCNIMCVRGQELTIPDFIRYSERFGPVMPHPSKSTRHPDYPKITMLGINKYDPAGKLREEIYRRLQQIDAGAIQLIPWEDARRRLRARLER